MIAEAAADLLARVRLVPALSASTGLTIGARTADPGLLKAIPPFAWVIYGGEQSAEAPFGTSAQGGYGMVPTQEMMLSTWRVVVYVPYSSDADMLATQYPLIEGVTSQVKNAVTTGPLGRAESPLGTAWRYIGQKLALIYNDRLAYEQHYTLEMPL